MPGAHAHTKPRPTMTDPDPLLYPVLIRWSYDDDAYLVTVPDLPGCMADGGTIAEAWAATRRAVREWAETAAELGRPIPEPSADDEPYDAGCEI